MTTNRHKAKAITGVNFYKKDIRNNKVSQQLAHRRIKLIGKISKQSPLPTDIDLGNGSSRITGIENKSLLNSSQAQTNRTLKTNSKKPLESIRNGVDNADPYIETMRVP